MLRFKTQGYEPYLRIEALRLDRMEEREMESLKEEAISAISKMPDSADIDEIMYRLYVIDGLRKGREAVLQGDVVSAEELKREIESW